jgi:hypothetical protein
LRFERPRAGRAGAAPLQMKRAQHHLPTVKTKTKSSHLSSLLPLEPPQPTTRPTSSVERSKKGRAGRRASDSRREGACRRVAELSSLPCRLEQWAPDDGSQRSGGKGARDELAVEEGGESVLRARIEEAEYGLDEVGGDRRDRSCWSKQDARGLALGRARAERCERL